MRRIFCSGLLAGAVLVLGQADIGRAQKENAGKYGWLSNLTQGMQLARQTGKPLMVVFRCEP